MNMQELLAAGVHFGHQTQKWDPRMKPFIFGARRGIHIINLEHTVPMFQKAVDFVEEIVAEGGDLLFVGTKRQAQPIVKDEASRCKMHYVNNRWLGGTLTNFKTIRASIDRLKELENNLEAGSYDQLKKKERRMIERETEKLRKSLSGIKNMDSLPAVIFVVDPHKETIAQKEANKLGIPLVALTDTNCNPEHIDYVIPGNDDSIKAIRIFASSIADACLAGLEKRQERIREEVVAESELSAKVVAPEKPVEFVPAKQRSFIGKDRAELAKERAAKSKKKPTMAANGVAAPEKKAEPAQEKKAESAQEKKAESAQEAEQKKDD